MIALSVFPKHDATASGVVDVSAFDGGATLLRFASVLVLLLGADQVDFAQLCAIS